MKTTTTITSRRGRRTGSRGFSMIELIAVMSVIAILSLVLAPAMIRVFDQMARDAEEKELRTLMTGLQGYILRNRQIPDASEFAEAIATELGLHPDEVAENARGIERIYLIDPQLEETLGVPWTQDPLGALPSLNAPPQPLPERMGLMLISSLSRPLPEALKSGVASSQEAFDAIWNLPEDEVPDEWDWNGRGEDLVIERLNVSDLFVQVILNNPLDPIDPLSTPIGRYTVDNSSTNQVPGAPGVFSTHFLKGTVLGLHDHEGLVNTLRVTDVLREDISFVYQFNNWRNDLYAGPLDRAVSPVDLQEAHDVFVSAPPNPGAANGVTQDTVIDSMAGFMAGYVAWANAGFNQEGQALVAELQQGLAETTADYLTVAPAGEDDQVPTGGDDDDGISPPGDETTPPSPAGDDDDHVTPPADDDDQVGQPGDDDDDDHAARSGDDDDDDHARRGDDDDDHARRGDDDDDHARRGDDDDDDHAARSGDDDDDDQAWRGDDDDDDQGASKSKNNNGHGNNEDGVDISNPGKGHGGPNGAEDPSAPVDDESKGGGSSQSKDKKKKK